MSEKIEDLDLEKISTLPPIVIQYEDLKAGKDLEEIIEQAYGPKGHGILFVDGIPGFVEARQETLPLFSKLATLPQETLKKYMRPEIFHSLGWSCGVEKFQGKFDVSKGSYYVNCVSDEPVKIKEEDLKHYSENELKINVGNKWVDELPELEKNVKKLAALMIDVGALLARQIDNYASRKLEHYPKGNLERIVKTGTGHIGRILHYFPFEKKEGKANEIDDWCGWHNDHGSLTALTSAMYVDKEGNEFEINKNSGGLYARNRFAEMARVAIPKHMLAFQLGESQQIHTGGYLEATPHCVVRNGQIAGLGIGRDTFALFMEPDHLEIMKTPDGVSENAVMDLKAYNVPQLKDRWVNGMTFKDFHMSTIKHYS